MSVRKKIQSAFVVLTIVLIAAWASIYGVAKCDGKWLGARIDKNDD